ncbi:MAG: YbaB/EbfC family nucleoid-associated protein [Deltaproteobacteria bacterium]|nr:YbaB/EbfC family nucleoid-associated protein [Deltaproteobacteria bacterium]
MMFKGLDMNELLGKAKEVQESFEQKKREAAQKKIEVAVGGGMVKITMNGNLEVLELSIDPEVVDKEDVATLEDLVRSAVNESVRQAKELSSTGFSDIMSGINLPDFKEFMK